MTGTVLDRTRPTGAGGTGVAGSAGGPGTAVIVAPALADADACPCHMYTFLFCSFHNSFEALLVTQEMSMQVLCGGKEWASPALKPQMLMQPQRPLPCSHPAPLNSARRIHTPHEAPAGLQSKAQCEHAST